MIGDHHQLPPVIKNMAFQKYSNMEQSLFTRFVRLGVPTVDLDAQGRARARSAVLIQLLVIHSCCKQDPQDVGVKDGKVWFVWFICSVQPVVEGHGGWVTNTIAPQQEALGFDPHIYMFSI